MRFRNFEDIIQKLINGTNLNEEDLFALMVDEDFDIVLKNYIQIFGTLMFYGYWKINVMRKHFVLYVYDRLDYNLPQITLLITKYYSLYDYITKNTCLGKTKEYRCSSMFQAIDREHVDCLQFLSATQNAAETNLMEYASMKGSIKSIERLLSDGFQKKENIIEIAIMHNHYEVVKFLLENGFPHKNNLISKAKSIRILAYLFNKGFDWGRNDLERFMMEKNINCFIFAKENNAPGKLEISDFYRC